MKKVFANPQDIVYKLPQSQYLSPFNHFDSMDKEQIIDNLWENANHGTRREDIEAAYEAGAAAERNKFENTSDLDTEAKPDMGEDRPLRLRRMPVPPET